MPPATYQPFSDLEALALSGLKGSQYAIIYDPDDPATPTGITERTLLGDLRTAIFAGTADGFSATDPINAGEATFASLTVPGVVTLAGLAYTWPATQSASRYLKTDGSGNLTWSSILETLALGDLSDVTLTSPGAGQMLAYNGAGVWLNTSDGTALSLSASNLATGTVPSARVAGAYTGVTGVGTVAAGTWNAGVIVTTYGGTGLSSFTAGDIPYYASGTALSKLGIGASATVLTSSSTAPQWSTAVSLGTSANTVSTLVARDGSGNFAAGTITASLAGNATSATTASGVPWSGVTGTPTTLAGYGITSPLNVAQGGTGLSTFTAAGGIAYATAATTLGVLAIGSAAQFMVVNGGATAPAWHTLVTADITDLTTAATGITKLGTIAVGVWQGTSISTTFTDAKIKTVTGTSNRLTIGGTSTDPTFDISTSYVGQATITTLGTIATGVWNGTAVVTTYGGTGVTTYVAGDMVYYAAGTALSRLAIGTADRVMTSSGTAPQWSTSLNLAGGATFATAVTVSAGGINVTGNSTITGTLGGITTLTATTLGGTLSTASQPNVTTMAGLTTAVALATVGTITSGTWNGTAITTVYGGTGLAAYSAGDLLYFASGTAFNKLAIGATNTVQVSTGSAPSWSTSLALAGTISTVGACTLDTGATGSTFGGTLQVGTTLGVGGAPQARFGIQLAASTTASSGAARMLNVVGTQVAAANNDVLTQINTGIAYTPGSFTGLQVLGLNIGGWTVAGFTSPADTAGIKVGLITGTGASNAYGLLITAPTGATANYLIADSTAAIFAVTSAGNVATGTTPISQTGFRLNNSLTAVAGAAHGFNITPTFVASANSDTLTALRIGPSFTPASFTGVNAFVVNIAAFSTAAFTSPGDPAMINVGILTGTGATNAYALKLGVPTGATNNYLISDATGAVFQVTSTGHMGLGAAASGTASLIISGSTTAAAGVAFGLNTGTTLIASANGDLLRGVRANASNLTPGAFTGVQVYGLDVTGFSVATFTSPADPTGINIGGITGTGATNASAIRFTAPSGATNNYLLLLTGAPNTFSVTAAGAGTFGGQVVAQLGGGTIPAAALSAYASYSGLAAHASGTGPRFGAIGLGSSAGFTGARYNGTVGSPTAIVNGNAIMFLSGGGYDGTTFLGSRGGIGLSATQDWVPGANGTQLIFTTTANGSAVAVTSLLIDQDQSATFSGLINAGNNLKFTTATGGLFFKGSTLTNQIYADASDNLIFTSGSSTTRLSLSATLLALGSGVILQLGSAYAAGVIAATGTIPIKDSTGTTYNVLVHV